MPDLEARQRLENELERVLIRAFSFARRILEDALYRQGMTTADLATIPPDVLQDIRRDMVQKITPILREGYKEAAKNFAEAIAFAIDEDALDEQSDQWVERYVPQLVDSLLNTRRRRLSRMAQQEARQISKRELATILLLLFSLAGVTAIVATEITNAISAGEMTVQQRLQASGAKVDEIWFTQLDERVCPICLPRHGKQKGDGWQIDPPAHPRCRCYKGYRIEHNGMVTVLFDDEAIARQLRQ